MTLPTVDFVHIEDEPYRDVAVLGESRIGVRVLNSDRRSGAVTAAVRLRPGQRLPAGRLETDLEVLVLTGSALLGPTGIGRSGVGLAEVERYCYLFRPAGSAVGPLVAGPEGLTAVVFFDERPAFTAGAPGAPALGIGPVHIADVPWEQPRTPGFPAGAARKTLRDDPESGRAFWILAVLPHWSSPSREWHTFLEENLVLEGEMQTAAGLMGPGGYLCHDVGPETAHGPMRSRPGAMMITRACGPLGTTYRATGESLAGPWR